MDFDRPPDFWTLVWIGLGVFVLFGCSCCCVVPLIPLAQQKGLARGR